MHFVLVQVHFVLVSHDGELALTAAGSQSWLQLLLMLKAAVNHVHEVSYIGNLHIVR